MANTTSSDINTPWTLQSWRNKDSQSPEIHPRERWTPLEPFFLSHGYTLWKALAFRSVEPPTLDIRAPDGFTYRTLHNDNDTPTNILFHMESPIHCPARTSDNRDVLIRLVAIEGDSAGDRHYKALTRLAIGNIASMGDNHTTPVLHQLKHDGMIFAVFPFMREGFCTPWYYQFSEVLDAVQQLLEGINFCHERLVAHLDLDSDNILINCGRGRTQAPGAMHASRPSPFRTSFPVRYYINDFEFAIAFDPGSEPSSRVISGLPTNGVRAGKYGRQLAPEMTSGAPYCPFRTDIWQLGVLFMNNFQQLAHLSQPLVELFKSMCSDDPESRPSASIALECVRDLNCSREILKTPVPAPITIKSA